MPAETLSEKLSRLRREKRQKNVNAAEAARPQAQRYRTRTDLQDFVVKQLSVAREYALGRMKLYFFEFALDDNIM